MVILIGWLGCRQRYIDKYAAIWAAWGADTLTFLPSTAGIVVPPLGDRDVRAFCATLSALPVPAPAPTPRPVILHSFSNAGWLFTGQLLRATAHPPPLTLPADHARALQALMHAHVAAVVLDSAPGRIDADVAARGFGAALANQEAEGFDGRYPLVTALARHLFRWYLRAPVIATRLREVQAAWATPASGWGGNAAPLLHLYSDADVLIPREDMEAFAAGQVRAGRRVQAVVFEGAPHVRLLQADPDKYREAVRAFVECEFRQPADDADSS